MASPIFTTQPINIIDLPADARHTGGTRALSAIEVIILHTTEGYDSRAWLSTDPNSVVSIHRLIQRTPYNPTTRYGGHYKILADDKIANQAGFGTIGNHRPGGPHNLNTIALGIELERQKGEGITAYQYDQATLQVAEWWGLYGFKAILSHMIVDPDRRSDPVNFDWDRFYRLLWSRLRGLG